MPCFLKSGRLMGWSRSLIVGGLGGLGGLGGGLGLVESLLYDVVDMMW